jgi:hypothetical protein
MDFLEYEFKDFFINKINADIYDLLLLYLKKCTKCRKYVCECCAYYPSCPITGGCELILNKCIKCKNRVCSECEQHCSMCCTTYCYKCTYGHKKIHGCYECIICINCIDKDPILLGVPKCTTCGKIMYGCCENWMCVDRINNICGSCNQMEN